MAGGKVAATLATTFREMFQPAVVHVAEHSCCENAYDFGSIMTALTGHLSRTDRTYPQDKFVVTVRFCRKFRNWWILCRVMDLPTQDRLAKHFVDTLNNTQYDTVDHKFLVRELDKVVPSCWGDYTSFADSKSLLQRINKFNPEATYESILAALCEMDMLAAIGFATGSDPRDFVGDIDMLSDYVDRSIDLLWLVYVCRAAERLMTQIIYTNKNMLPSMDKCFVCKRTCLVGAHPATLISGGLVCGVNTATTISHAKGRDDSRDLWDYWQLGVFPNVVFQIDPGYLPRLSVDTLKREYYHLSKPSEIDIDIAPEVALQSDLPEIPLLGWDLQPGWIPDLRVCKNLKDVVQRFLCVYNNDETLVILCAYLMHDTSGLMMPFGQFNAQRRLMSPAAVLMKHFKENPVDESAHPDAHFASLGGYIWATTLGLDAKFVATNTTFRELVYELGVTYGPMPDIFFDRSLHNIETNQDLFDIPRRRLLSHLLSCWKLLKTAPYQGEDIAYVVARMCGHGNPAQTLMSLQNYAASLVLHQRNMPSTSKPNPIPNLQVISDRLSDQLDIIKAACLFGSYRRHDLQNSCVKLSGYLDAVLPGTAFNRRAYPDFNLFDLKADDYKRKVTMFYWAKRIQGVLAHRSVSAGDTINMKDFEKFSWHNWSGVKHENIIGNTQVKTIVYPGFEYLGGNRVLCTVFYKQIPYLDDLVPVEFTLKTPKEWFEHAESYRKTLSDVCSQPQFQEWDDKLSHLPVAAGWTPCMWLMAVTNSLDIEPYVRIITSF